MTPLKYIEYSKDDIYANMAENPILNYDEAYNIIVSIIEKLSKVRNSESKTTEILEELNSYSGSYKFFFQNWLIKALDDDYSFVYAYNYLCIDKIRRTRMAVYLPKEVNIPTLIKCLKAENPIK